MSAHPVWYAIVRYRTFLISLFAILAVQLFHSAARAADCPLKLDTLSLAGNGASGKAVMYEVDAEVDGPTPFGANLDVITSRGITHVKWNGINPPQNISPEQASFWFERPADDVISVRVANAAGQKCADPPTAVDSSIPEKTVVTTYDDSIHHEELVDVHPDDMTKITDSQIKNRVHPIYPINVADAGIQGDVMVGVDVGPKGQALFAWVRAHETTYWSNALDDAALWAALHTTYSPPLENGKPTTRQYLLDYTFRLDNGPESPTLKYPDLCPLVLSGLRVSNGSGAGSPQWYSFSVDASSDDIASAVIGTANSKREISGIRWDSVALQKSDKDPNAWYTSATFNWSGSPIVTAWIDSVTTKGGKVRVCQPVVSVPPDEPAGATHLRYIIGDPVPELGVQQLQSARFKHERLPLYPSSAVDDHVGGDAVIETLVDENGDVKEAFVTQSSGDTNLDAAALFAAESSTYVAAKPNGVALYEARYCFIP